MLYREYMNSSADVQSDACDVRLVDPERVASVNARMPGAEDIVDAMDLRGFGTGKRTWLRQLAYQDLDRWALGVMALTLVVATVADLTGYLNPWYPPGWR